MNTTHQDSTAFDQAPRRALLGCLIALLAYGCSTAANGGTPSNGDDGTAASRDESESTDESSSEGGTKSRDGGKGDASKSDANKSDGGPSSNPSNPSNPSSPSGGPLPNAVGFIMQSISGSAGANCPATLIAPNRVATLYRCIATSFVGPGGQTATGTNYFSLASDVNDSSKWKKVSTTTKYEFLALAELEGAIAGVTPVKIPSGPLQAADVGKTFVTARFEGRKSDGSVPAGRQLVGSSTVLKAISGQPFHSVFASYDAFVDAYTDFQLFRDDYKADGPFAKFGPAQIYQRPLLGPYEIFTVGANEAALQGGGIDTRGAPLLREQPNGDYELVGVYRESVDAAEDTVVPFVLGSYYAALPADSIAMLNGNGQNGTHCGDIKTDIGQCRNGFALNCGVFGGEIIDIATSNSYFCGEPSKCSIHPFATDPNKTYARCD